MKHLRRYSVGSLAHHVVEQLRRPSSGKDAVEYLRGIPWQALLLLKWALLDSKVPLRGPALSKRTYDALRQKLWEVDIYRGPERDLNVHLMIRSLSYVQMEFQRPQNWDMLRWPALVSMQPPESPLRRQFRESFRLEPDDFIDLSLALLGGLLQGKGEIVISYLEPLRASYGAKVDTLLELFVRDLAGLRRELQADPAQSARSRIELVEFPYIQRFPLVSLAGGRLAWWHELVFARGLETAVHQRLSYFGEAYTQAFSRVFEQYVQELASAMGEPIVHEEIYKAKVGASARAVESIIQAAGCNVVVEAKMGLFPDALLISDNERAILEKTKRVRAAIAQTSEVAAALLDPVNPFYRQDCATSYALIVTSRELNFATGPSLQKLIPGHPISYPSDAARRALPLDHVIVLSIRSMERLADAVNSGQLDLPAFLTEVVQKEKLPGSARNSIEDHLASKVRRFRRTQRIDEAFKSAHTRLEGVLGS